MKPDQLRNLLTELETRVGRAERSYAQTGHIAQPLGAVKADIRRHLSKADSLRAAHVASLEKQIAKIPIPDDRWNLANLLLGLKIGLNQMGPDELLESLPGQKPAAFQFGFDDDRIVVVDQPLRTLDREKDIAATALEAATEKGVYVGEQLALSNCSPRLRDAFRALQDKREARANIIQVGMYNQTCAASCGAMLTNYLRHSSNSYAPMSNWFSPQRPSLKTGGCFAKMQSTSIEIPSMHSLRAHWLSCAI